MFKNKKVLSLILVFIVCFSSVFSVNAAKSVNELKKEINKRNEEMKQKEKEINSKKAEKDEELEKRNALDLQISALIDDISDVEVLIDEKQKEIDEKNAEIDEINASIEEKKDKLNQRLKVMYEYGATSYLELLLEAKGLGDLVTRISVIRSVYNYDKNIINEFVQSRALVEESKKVIEAEQNEQLEAKQILDGKKSEIEDLKREKQEIIDSLNSDIKALEKEEKKIEADYESLQAELKSALNSDSDSGGSTYSGNGKFLWPSAVSKRVTSPYGYRTHPISGKRTLHRGIDIAAPLGSNVLAAEDGKVVTAGWNNSYGYYVTINHGGGYVTLYAHNSKLVVSKGQTVKKGDVIAKCGSTGSSTGNHIHFEVMLNGNLKNPMDYL